MLNYIKIEYLLSLFIMASYGKACDYDKSSEQRIRGAWNDYNVLQSTGLRHEVAIPSQAPVLPNLTNNEHAQTEKFYATCMLTLMILSRLEPSKTPSPAIGLMAAHAVAPRSAAPLIKIQDLTQQEQKKSTCSKAVRTKKYSCSYCPYKAKQKNTINIHERMHTGEKPFKCPDCNHKFTQKCNLVRHYKTQHITIKEYSCVHCGEDFNRKSHAQQHMKNKHNIHNIASANSDIALCLDDDERKEITQLLMAKKIQTRLPVSQAMKKLTHLQ